MFKRFAAVLGSVIFSLFSTVVGTTNLILDYSGRADLVSNFGEPGTITAKALTLLTEVPWELSYSVPVLLTLGWLYFCHKWMFPRAANLGAPTDISRTSETLLPPITKISDLTAVPTSTSLRLQFVGGKRAPTAQRAENILSWYAIWCGHLEIMRECPNFCVRGG
jgi:hypothetical protein